MEKIGGVPVCPGVALGELYVWERASAPPAAEGAARPGSWSGCSGPGTGRRRFWRSSTAWPCPAWGRTRRTFSACTG